MLTRALVLTVAAVLLAGCNGGTVDRHALTNDAATIDSIACEGALARARRRAWARRPRIFAREQAEELAIQASNLADALAERHDARVDRAEGAREGEGRGEARGDVCSACTTIRPTAQVAATVERQLKQLGGCT